MGVPYGKGESGGEGKEGNRTRADCLFSYDSGPEGGSGFLGKERGGKYDPLPSEKRHLLSSPRAS